MNTDSSLHLSSRRRFLGNAGLIALSAGGVALLAGRDALAAAAPADVRSDVAILNVALGLEHEGINAYTIGAQSGLLQPPVLAIAVKFQDDHKAHRDLLTSAIRKIGGKPVEAVPVEETAKALNADTLKNQTDILQLAARLELGATNAYLGVIPSFKEAALAQVAGRLAADEAVHWTLLNNALGRPMMKAMGFGA